MNQLNLTKPSEGMLKSNISTPFGEVYFRSLFRLYKKVTKNRSGRAQIENMMPKWPKSCPKREPKSDPKVTNGHPWDPGVGQIAPQGPLGGPKGTILDDIEPFLRRFLIIFEPFLGYTEQQPALQKISKTAEISGTLSPGSYLPHISLSCAHMYF